ncbi:MAG: hypothetical protein JWM80_5201 [Cyanobacteria bacterium RYN_339]|nr:hypothetical protein [Cyanobacteria bacterium RYN_339]
MLGIALAAVLVAQSPDEPLDIQADRTTYAEDGQVVEASGHVRVEHLGVLLQCEALHLDLRTRRGTLTGPVLVKGGPFEVEAVGASFDLDAKVADLTGFKGHWADRAQFAGDRLVIGTHVFQLDGGWVTSCMAPTPDLQLVARTFRFFPEAPSMNLAGEGVALRVLGHDLLTLPYFNATVGKEKGQEIDAGSLFPAFGFDAYRGFLTSTRFDFSVGENSRGSVPIEFTSSRGWTAGIEHALSVGPGEIRNAVQVQTPWATGRGGVSVLNAYNWSLRDGSQLEVNGDYRALLNGQPVHRIPDLAWLPATLNVGGVVAIHPELRAGYLWEESSGQQATRLRVASSLDTPVWSPLPGWQTSLNASPWVHHYILSPYAGFTSAWNVRQDWGRGFQSNQALEFSRVYGETPFLFDRQYDAERLRLGVTMDWSSAVFTGVSGSWSRMNQSGPFSVEDVAVTTTYRWNCFGLSLVLHPIVWGVETHLAAGMF